MEIDICPRWLFVRLGVPPECRSHAAILFSALLAIAAAPVLIAIPHLCLAQAFLHIPCPGCGVLHALAALLRLQFMDAWHSNPAGILVGLLFGFQLIARPLAMAYAGTRDMVSMVSRRSSSVVVSSLVLVWLFRLISGGY